MDYDDLPRISRWAQVKELMDAGKLTPAEVRVIEAAKEGEIAWLGETVPTSPNKAVLIRAPLLRYLILGGCADFQTETAGAQVLGAWIAGTLDLNFAKGTGVVGLFSCYIAEQPQFMHSEIHFLNVNGSTLRKGMIAHGAQVAGGVFMRSTIVTGEVSLTGSVIKGQLDCGDATLDNPSGNALNAQGARVEGGVFLRNVTAKGDVSLSGVEIIGELACTGAIMTNPNGSVLNAQGARVGDKVSLNDIVATGWVSLASAEVTGSLDCSGATLENAVGDALNMQDVKLKGGFFWRNVKAISGEIDLNSAHLGGGLVDDAASWEKCDQLCLVAMTYDSLHGSTDVTERLRWLKKGAIWDGEFHPQPYEQLAKVLRETGHRAEAYAVLVDKEVRQRAATRERWRNERQMRRTLWRRSKQNALALSEETEKAFVHFTTQDTLDRFKVLHPAPDHPERDALLITGRYDISPYVMQQAQRDFRNQQKWTNLGLRLKIGAHWCADKLLRGIIGYGYRPQRSFYALLCLIGFAWLVAHYTWETGDFAPNSDVILSTEAWQVLADDREAYPNPAMTWSDKLARGEDYETFDALYYAMDVVVPIISLGQEAAWAPSTNRGDWGWWLWWLRYWLTILGWIVTAIGAAAVTGIIRKD